MTSAPVAVSAGHPWISYVSPVSNQNVALCQPLFVNWIYHGEEDPRFAMNLYITNGELNSGNPSTASSSSSRSSTTTHTSSSHSSAVSTNPAAPTIDQREWFSPGGINGRSAYRRSSVYLLAHDIPAASGNLTWTQVAVPPGIYVLAASFPKSELTYTIRSPVFTVDGKNADTGCLTVQNQSHAGRIAGSVIGGLAALAALIACLLFFRYKHIRKRRVGTQRFGETIRSRPWARLGNTTDVKAPVPSGAGGFEPEAHPSPAQHNTVPAPTFIRAPPALHDPFGDA
ncbi:hypothetical protein DL96DRAFT_1589394 [Flagelloscypha sp. PMI_526]|nr:hypothetical protein DL96DRAFT_1589394 [Flagelloscypha sp. PMI_526]